MPNPQQSRVVDMRIPLHWLLSSAAAILLTLAATLWNIAGQSNKLDQLILTNTKMEKRLDDRDGRIDGIRDRIFGVESTINTMQLRLEGLERAADEKAKRP